MDLHPKRPSVYLDQWVWIRLTRAAAGRPSQRADATVLRAVEAATRAGVVFPLSATHYFEVQHMPRQDQREEVSRLMARVSQCQTLRGGSDLLRHQILSAMHQLIGRPTFPPAPPQIVGLGVAWAMVGTEAPLRVYDSRGQVDLSGRPAFARMLVRANQHAEYRFLAGPTSDELDDLHARGYAPESIAATAKSRLEWEQIYADIVAGKPVARDEMRVQLLARQLIHEHLQQLQGIGSEYRLSLSAILGDGRALAVAFAEHVPTLAIAADLKTELFRSAANWSASNHLYDVDAMSQAVPYCHVVVPDKQMRDLLARSHAEARYGTQIVRLDDLPDILSHLSAHAATLAEDRNFWPGLSHTDEFSIDMPERVPFDAEVV